MRTHGFDEVPPRGTKKDRPKVEGVALSGSESIPVGPPAFAPAELRLGEPAGTIVGDLISEDPEYEDCRDEVPRLRDFVQAD
jgi:hypothetical protein